MSDESAECPLCMEALEIDDHSFFPCTCGYQICRFCWHRIRTDENGLCPACRKQYPENPAEFKPLTDDVLQNIKKERKQKDVQRKQKAAENRKHLANVRVVQRNLVFVVGLSPRLADPEVLKKHEYFGKFGKIHKVVINQSTSYAGSQGPSPSAYVTYIKPEDALKAILTVNNVHVDGRTLKTSLGTTKYCSHFLKASHCQMSDCMYLHELGEEAASFTKEEMQAGKHQEYEQMLIEQFLNSQNAACNNSIANNKIKKPASPQAIESSEIIPSLMDMTSDIKLTQHNLRPLLPNPAQGGASAQVHINNSNSNWPVLDGMNSSSFGNGPKSELSTPGSNSKAQSNKLQLRTDTPPVGSNSRVVGMGSQRSNSSASSVDENHIPNKKPASPQAVESLENIPLQMDMTGDIKQTQNNNLRPLLSNPAQGASSAQVHINNSNSNLPVLDGINSSTYGNGSKSELSTPGSNSKAQSNKLQHRTDTPPVGITSRVVGMGSQRSNSSASSVDENHIPNATSTPCSNRAPSSTPPGDRENGSNSPQNDQPSHRSLPLQIRVSNVNHQLPLSLRPGSVVPVCALTPPDHITSISNGIHAQSKQLQQQTDQFSADDIGAIGSDRRPGLSEAYITHGLSFFDLPNVSPASQEIAESLPVSSCTDWSAAFGFRNKELLPDDDLGFDPCAESFKGLADLMEKENGMQQQQQQYVHMAQQQQKMLGSPPQTNYLAHSLPLSPLQNNAQQLRNIPPGFSISHLQQHQQQQHFFRQEMNNSKMLDLLPQFTPTAHQRFPPLSSYHSLPPDLQVQQQQLLQQPLQREYYSMTDMQEQLRSMLPNINISFGSIPNQQHAQQQHPTPTSMYQTQHSQQINKNWPLSCSPDSSLWNDPAIVSTSQFTDSAGIFQDPTPHWLMSLQQLTESESASNRLPFVQQFPLAGVGAWPPHTYNPPPGFRAGGLPNQQATDAHKMAEVLQ